MLISHHWYIDINGKEGGIPPLLSRFSGQKGYPAAKKKMKRLFYIILLILASIFLIPVLAIAQEMTIGNYNLVSKERVGRTEFNYTYRADVTNTGSAVRNVTATVKSDSEHTSIVDGTLNFGEVPARDTVTSNNTFTIRQDRLFPFDPEALVWTVQAEPVSPPVSEPSKVEFDLIRNGAFELEETGWTSNQWTFRDDGKEGAGMRISPFEAPNGQGFIMQELHLPSEVESGVFSFEYRFEAQPGLNPFLVGFWASLMTLQGELLAILHTIDVNSFPGFDWQSVRVNLDTDALNQLNAAPAKGERVFLLISLMGEFIEVHVDNVSFQIEGTMKLPNIPGVIAYIRDTKEIRRVRPDGSKDSLIWSSPESVSNNNIFDVAWQPDAKALAFSSNHEYGYSRWSSDIYLINPDGSDIRRVTNPPALSNLPGDYQTGIVKGKVHNDTGRIISVVIYVQGATKPAQKSSALLSPDGNAGDTLDFTIEAADLGPGVGQYIAVWSEGYSEAQVAVDVEAGMTVDAGIIDYIGLKNTHTVSQITWHGDGSEMSFVLSMTLRRVKASAIFTDTDEPLLNLNLLASELTWSPEGDKILYVQMMPSEKEGIYLTDADSSNEGTRLVFPTEIGSSSGDAVWLPDGSGFLFVQRQTKPTGAFAADIFQYDMGSGQSTPLTDFSYELAAHPSPSPDGKYIVFERLPQNGEYRDLWVMKRDNPTVMWPLTNDGKSGNPDWSRAEP